MRPHTPTTSAASMPSTSWRSVVFTRWPTAPGARPWCDSPQPTSPSSVVTLTTTASRLTAVPMPSETRASGGTGNDVGNARTSAILIEDSPSLTQLSPRGSAAQLELRPSPPPGERVQKSPSPFQGEGRGEGGRSHPEACPCSAVHVLAAHERLHGAVRVEDVALESHEVLAVDVDLQRVLGGGVVHGVDLVVGRHETRHGTGLVAEHLTDLESHLVSQGARAPRHVARLLDLVLDHAHQPPRLVIVRARFITRPPDHGGDVESRAPVEDVAAPLARGRGAILGGNRLRIGAELREERRGPAGDHVMVQRSARDRLEVLDELLERVFHESAPSELDRRVGAAAPLRPRAVIDRDLLVPDHVEAEGQD